MARSSLVIDRAESERRRALLDEYLSTAVDDGQKLTCRAAARCRASATKGSLAGGQLSHVGPGYALADRGRQLRILVVPMQTGRPDNHVTMAERAGQVDSAKDASAAARTRHMDGTALALKVVLGLDPEADDEVAPGIHVFDCFAMANATLCSYMVPGKGAGGEGTTPMRDGCRAHLRRTIALLEPNVVIALGVNGPSGSVAGILGVPHRPRSVTAVRRGDREVGVAQLSHPSREWPTSTHSVFRREVMPALRRVRAIALGEA